MTEENKNYTETEIMLGALDRVIREEMKKRPSKRDNQLIDECIAEMAKLKNVRAGYTEEEIGAIVERLQEKAATSKKTPVRRKSVRRMAAVVCAIGLIMVGSIATVAWNPLEVIGDWVTDITYTPFGTDTKIGNITYTNHGKHEKYNDICELIEDQELNVYYPAVLPENVSITKVELLVIDNKEYIKFHFNDSEFHFTVQHDGTLYLNSAEYETIKTNIATFYIAYQNGVYIAQGNIESNLYIVECSDYEYILLMLNNFIKGQ